MIADDQVQTVDFSVDNLTSYQNLGPAQMSTIDSLPLGNTGLTSILKPTQTATGDDSKEAASVLTTIAPTEGIKVSLSGAGIQKATGSSGKNRDIEESGLPDAIQQTLKIIRKLQQQIAEKMAELQAVLTDKRLSPEQVKAKVGALQAAISGLSAGLITAQTALSKAIKQAGLSPDQVLKAASLAMKP